MVEKIRKSSGNVFIDLGFPPHEAAVMLLRAQLAEALRSWMEQNELTQAQAARKLGISQPRLSEITRGKVELLSLDYLVGLCAKADTGQDAPGGLTDPGWQAPSPILRFAH